jgi:RNA polymerase sporulation-specific sigma factor
MISAFLLLLCNSLFLSLHLSGGTGSFPKPLTAAQEREYLRRCAEGDMEARNLLVEHNLRLVAHIMKKYYTQADDQEDLISIGTIGLIKAVNTFRADKGIRLATYASRCIENAILSQRNKRRLRWKGHEPFWGKMVYVLPPESPQLCIGCECCRYVKSCAASNSQVPGRHST